MIKKEKFLFLFLMLGVIIILASLSFVSSATICCERDSKGSICQDTAAENCAVGEKRADTSCSQTSFCKLGTCIDNAGGECKPNTAKKACDDINGFWDERSTDKIPQCSLGCCFLGTDTTFVTKTQCKALSGMYGVNISFDTNIKNALECLASGVSEAKGACVYTETEEFGNACKFTTEAECRKIRVDFANSNAEFYKDYLCTAEELNTNCAKPSTATGVKTICNEEDVYFVDSCGNLANIYDSSKYNDENYWTKIVKSADSCSVGSSNANSQTCGNCNYNLGSTCSEAKRGETAIPKYGSYFCRDLSCEYDNNGDGTKEKYQHGEKWCAKTPGTSSINSNKTVIPNSFGENLPGSEYVILSCYYGKVDSVGCGNGMRDQICIENTIYPDDVTPFRNAKCSQNIWGDCISISNKGDCENIEKRDCKWISTFSRTSDNRLTTWKPQVEGDKAPLIKTDSNLPKGKINLDKQGILNLIKGSSMEGIININNYNLGNLMENVESNFQNGVCVPKYAPGFDFTGTITKIKGMVNAQSGADICSLANAICVIKKEKHIGGAWTTVANSECEEFGPAGAYLWYESMKNICVSLGDCGATVNYIGEAGDAKKDFVKTDSG